MDKEPTYDELIALFHELKGMHSDNMEFKNKCQRVIIDIVTAAHNEKRSLTDADKQIESLMIEKMSINVPLSNSKMFKILVEKYK